MTPRYFLAILGFAFIAAWIAFGFGDALLCLLGAGVFAAIGAIVEGDIDLGELQGRLRTDASGSAGKSAGGASYEPPPRVR